MSVMTGYVFPFPCFTRKTLDRALAKVEKELPGITLKVDEDASEPDEGEFEVTFVERAASGPRGGILLFSSDPEGSASLNIDHDHVADEALETAGQIADAFCRLLGGRPEDEDDDDDEEDDSEDDDDDEDSEDDDDGAEFSDGFASWEDVCEHLRARYAASVDDPEEVVLTWSWTNPDRSQLVLVSAATVLDEPWVVIRSPMAPRIRVSLDQAFEFALNVNGKLVRDGDNYALEFSLPMAALTQQRLLAALADVACDADDFEEEVLGTDEL